MAGLKTIVGPGRDGKTNDDDDDETFVAPSLNRQAGGLKSRGLQNDTPW
jgi:hypothetical protein